MNVVAHNIMALNAARMNGIISTDKKKSTEKLSSGYRINRAADDAAGLSISEKMRAQIRGLDRASQNIQDGISLVQVADGALSEDHAILHRMRELSIQAANDTNTTNDRMQIQTEISQLVSEIDRTANTTTFNNDIYPLLGNTIDKTEFVQPTKLVEIEMKDIDVPPAIPPDDAGISVTWTPFGTVDANGNFSNDNYKDFNYMKLQASVKEGGTTKLCNLLFNNGSTSHSRIRLRKANADLIGNDASVTDISAANFKFESYTKNNDKDWSRTFTASNADGSLSAKITQNIKVSDDNKNYVISYDITPSGDSTTDYANFEFLMNMDTSYGGDYQGDIAEGYYTNGSEIGTYSIYKPTSYPDLVRNNALFIDKTLNNNTSSAISNNYPDSISIINRTGENKLPFSEKISFSDWKPVISLGKFAHGSNTWDYYSSKDNAENNYLGKDMTGDYQDKTTTLIWSLGDTVTTISDLNQNHSYHIQFNYGIEDKKTDPNLPDSTKKTKWIEVPDPDAAPIERKVKRPEELNIQSGALSGQNIKLELVDATAKTLGIKDPALDVTSFDGASDAMYRLGNAIDKVSSYRANFGAQQNRLETAMRVDDNTSENTSAAESRIRDTDMAKEIVNYSKHSILEQTGQSMLSQANQQTQGVLQLLQ